MRPAARYHRRHDGPRERQQQTGRAGARNFQQIARAVVQHRADPPQACPPLSATAQPDQVGVIEFVVGQRRQAGARHGKGLAAQGVGRFGRCDPLNRPRAPPWWRRSGSTCRTRGHWRRSADRSRRWPPDRRKNS